MNDKVIKKTIHCPECENHFDCDMTEIEVGDITECLVCGANLEVVNVDPLTVEAVTTYK